MYLHTDQRTTDPLESFLSSGGATRWVALHDGNWGHEDWLRLLAQLAPARLLPVEVRMLGHLLEDAKMRFSNLRRWIQTGAARRWVDERAGLWDHQDWIALLGTLQDGGFWPIDPTALGQVLEKEKQRWARLREWDASGRPRRWVAQRHGHWGHEDWWALIAEVEHFVGGPIQHEAVAALLERYRARWWTLQRWLSAGGARQWVEEHEHGWTHEEWLRLLGALEAAGTWTEAEWIGEALEQTRQRYLNVRRWQASGAARHWVEERQGEWDHTTWLALLTDLERVWGPIDPGRVGLVLEQEQRRYRNLRWWQESDDARLWVLRRRGEWGHQDWLDLLARIERSTVWPVYPDAVARVMEQLRGEFHHARRWLGLQAA